MLTYYTEFFEAFHRKIIVKLLRMNWQRGDGIVRCDKFFFRNRYAGNYVFANCFIGPPLHTLGFGMLVAFPINDDRTVEHPGIFIKLPPSVVVPDTSMLRA